MVAHFKSRLNSRQTIYDGGRNLKSTLAEVSRWRQHNNIRLQEANEHALGYQLYQYPTNETMFAHYFYTQKPKEWKYNSHGNGIEKQLSKISWLNAHAVNQRDPPLLNPNCWRALPYTKSISKTTVR